MVDVQEFEKLFDGLELPSELRDLINFERQVALPGVFYSVGFELCSDASKAVLKTYSEEPNFLSGFLEFARADGSGSTYAFWLGDDRERSLSLVPIVVFGSEGGYHIVAENIRELFRILSFDAEPMVSWDKVNYYKDSDEGTASKGREVFARWLKRLYGIDVCDDADAIVERSQKKVQEHFLDWMHRYV